MKLSLEEIFEIAYGAHEGQFRFDGVTEYIIHPVRVRKRLSKESYEVQAAALLHDVIEDTKVTEADLRARGIEEVIIQAVIALTKLKTETNEEYWTRVKANEIATKVKIADVIDNISDDPSKRQLLKYANCLIFLLKDEI